RPGHDCPTPDATAARLPLTDPHLPVSRERQAPNRRRPEAWSLRTASSVRQQPEAVRGCHLGRRGADVLLEHLEVTQIADAGVEDRLAIAAADRERVADERAPDHPRRLHLRLLGFVAAHPV